MGDARCGSGNPGNPPGSRSCLGHRHRPRSGGHCPRSVRAVGELRRVFVQTGIFRDVRTWHLLGTDPDAAEPLSVARTPDGERRSVHEVSDPSGRRLVIVVTDTVASGWAEADVARVLRQWASHGPVALLNVLPRRLWDRGAVRPRSLSLRAVGPASPTTSWRVGAPVRSHRRSVRLRPTSHVLAIPVVEAEPASVLLLAKLVAGAGQWTRVPCLVIPRTPSPPAPLRAESLAPAREEVTDTLSRFRAGASPLAQQLAAYLSAVPLSLPVMNLVRRTMLPEAEHGHLAEVALSGLFTPWAQEAAETRTASLSTSAPGSGQHCWAASAGTPSPPYSNWSDARRARGSASTVRPAGATSSWGAGAATAAVTEGSRRKPCRSRLGRVRRVRQQRLPVREAGPRPPCRSCSPCSNSWTATWTNRCGRQWLARRKDTARSHCCWAPRGRGRRRPSLGRWPPCRTTGRGGLRGHRTNWSVRGNGCFLGQSWSCPTSAPSCWRPAVGRPRR
ncbi:SAV_2336 N-terminal domain-related protein [Streptomyces sp. NPDC048332]|uniref:SAV_2336 N-terminal domain-related protein n=1 Tax=Streptomyces sp. NPDC048332 TaxID=3154619 RepID=UPI003446670E